MRYLIIALLLSFILMLPAARAEGATPLDVRVFLPAEGAHSGQALEVVVEVENLQGPAISLSVPPQLELPIERPGVIDKAVRIPPAKGGPLHVLVKLIPPAGYPVSLNGKSPAQSVIELLRMGASHLTQLSVPAEVMSQGHWQMQAKVCDGPTVVAQSSMADFECAGSAAKSSAKTPEQKHQ